MLPVPLMVCKQLLDDVGVRVDYEMAIVSPNIDSQANERTRQMQGQDLSFCKQEEGRSLQS